MGNFIDNYSRSHSLTAAMAETMSDGRAERNKRKEATRKGLASLSTFRERIVSHLHLDTVGKSIASIGLFAFGILESVGRLVGAAIASVHGLGMKIARKHYTVENRGFGAIRQDKPIFKNAKDRAIAAVNSFSSAWFNLVNAGATFGGKDVFDSALPRKAQVEQPYMSTSWIEETFSPRK